MNRNEKIDKQFEELEVLAEKHKKLVKKNKCKIAEVVIYTMMLVYGLIMSLYSIIAVEDIANFVLGLFVIIMSIFLNAHTLSEIDDIEYDIDELEEEIDKKIEDVTKDLSEEFNKMTQKFIEELKNNREKAEQDAKKCSKNGKNTKNNTQKAENKTKSVAKTTKGKNNAK